MAQKPAPETSGLTTDLCAVNLIVLVAENVCVAEKQLPVLFETRPIGETLHTAREAEMEGALVIFESSKGG